MCIKETSSEEKSPLMVVLKELWTLLEGLRFAGMLISTTSTFLCLIEYNILTFVKIQLETYQDATVIERKIFNRSSFIFRSNSNLPASSHDISRTVIFLLLTLSFWALLSG